VDRYHTRARRLQEKGDAETQPDAGLDAQEGRASARPQRRGAQRSGARESRIHSRALLRSA